VSRSIPSIAALLAVSLLLSACGSSSSSGGSSAASAMPAAPQASASSSGGLVRTVANPKLGTILTDAKGMTLYRLSGESAGKFICTSKVCLAAWHPLFTTPGSKLTGANLLGTVQRPDGSQQVTYNGQPLYTFAPDKQPGQTSGEGVKDVGTWNTLKVAGGS
jgi:predicted lipoprotein with Yx(FWY)xxD motif